jgi:hypothetical protein
MNKLVTTIVFISTVLCQGEWLPGTAYTLPKGRWEIGLFQPVRWGQNDTREISFFKLTSFLMPNLTVKQRWNKKNEWTISTSHSFYYPTPLLRKLQSPLGMNIGEPNMFALISPQFEIPHMVSFGNSVIASKPLSNNKYLTVNVGFAFALGGPDLANESTIDLPLIYHRLAVYYNGWMVRFGSNYNGNLSEKWSYLIDGDLLLIPGMKGSYSLEHKGMLTWAKSQYFNISFGYKMVAGLYPDGYPNENKVRLHLLPFFDLQWSK